MQLPLEDLSPNARLVHTNLAADPESTRSVDTITDTLDGQLTGEEVEDALRELQAALHAAETFGGWSVLV